MKRNRIRRFFQQKQYAIASMILFVAIAGMTGVYLSNRITSQKQQAEEFANEETKQPGKTPEYVSLSENNNVDLSKKEDSESVNSVIRPRKTQPAQADKETKPQTAASTPSSAGMQDNASPGQGQDKAAGADNETVTQAKAAGSKKLDFSPETDLGWPLHGDVILNYSMDQTVYFATLEQYKYNPALIIAGRVNDPVQAAATGRITDISTNEETGVTVTMDLGNGYSAVYGQLKEVLYKEGAAVEAGNAIGYIAEPTKYYSVEGSNLYFKLLKDGEPVNPMQYIE